MATPRQSASFPDWNTRGDPRLLDSINRRTPDSANSSVIHTFGSTIIIPKKQRRGRGGSSEPCPFGEITTWTVGEGESAEKKTGLLGGIIHCGINNWGWEHFELDVSSDRDDHIYFEIECESNRDDDNEIFLPGIKEGTRPTVVGFVAYADPPEYPDNDPPSLLTGIGTIIIPIGRLVVSGSSVTLTQVECGNITITQCGGSLSYTRG